MFTVRGSDITVKSKVVPKHTFFKTHFGEIFNLLLFWYTHEQYS